jgi:hypothetical protein
MSEPNQNDFAEVIGQIQRGDVVDYIETDEDTQAQLSDSLTALFVSVMENLEVSEDEEQANTDMQVAILAMMDTSFKAGMLYRSYQSPPDNDSLPIPINAEIATQMMFGLMGSEGFSIRFRVDRG